MQSLKSGGIQAGILGMFGLFAAVAAGWIAESAGSVDTVAERIASLYFFLAILLPAILGVYTWANLSGEERPLYATRRSAFPMLLFASLAGGLLASAVYLVVTLNIAAIFGGIDNVALRLALLDRFGDNRLILVVGITIVMSLLIAEWAFRQASAEKSKTD